MKALIEGNTTERNCIDRFVCLDCSVWAGWKCVTQLSMPAAVEITWWITVVFHKNAGEIN